MMWTISILVLLVSFTPLTFSTNLYSITQLNNGIGIYFNNLGNAKISNTKFTLLSYFNLSVYDEKFMQLENYFEKSSTLCSHKSTSALSNHAIYFCKNSIQNLQIDIDSLKDKVETVKHLTGHTRNKRGIFNGASYAFHWLFGIPDADDAKFYDDSIKSLLDDDKNVQLLMKQQIGIISDTIKNFNASISNLKLNEQKLNNNLEIFNNFSLKASAAINDAHLQILISEQITLLNQITFELNNYYDLLISSITLAKHNILHPQIITPLTLLKELSKINLKQNKQFPIALNYQNIHYYFELINLNVIYINKNLIFALQIPLVDELDYNLYEVLSLPTPHNSSFLYSYIEPSYPYLIISKTKVYYTQLGNLNKCRYTKASSYICFEQTITRTYEKPACETTLLTSFIKKIPETCKTHTIKANLEIWHRINNNQWIFTISTPLQLTLTCEDEPIKDITVESTGIININPGCKGYTQNYVLETTQVGLTQNYSNPVPQYNIAQDDCCRQKERILNTSAIHVEPLKFTNIKLDELKYASHKLKQFEDILQEHLDKPTKMYHKNWFISGISAIGSLIMLFILYLILRCCGCCQLCKALFRCLFKSHKYDDCCPRIFNTNIVSATPPSRMQLSRILRNQELQGMRDTTSQDIDDDSQNELPLTTFQPQARVPVSNRKAITTSPLINMF